MVVVTNQDLIISIFEVFKNVQLGDGIGLWEGLALDDREQDPVLLGNAKAKDERDDWIKIPVQDLFACRTAISFVDAQGMRFLSAPFMLLALDYYKIDVDFYTHLYKKYADDPNFEWTLKGVLDKNNPEYSQSKFNLFSKEQLQCVVDFLAFYISKQRNLFLMAETELQTYENAKQYYMQLISIEKKSS